MRLIVAAAWIVLPWPRLLGCSCAGGSTPCSAAGSAAAAFTGTVLNVADPPAPIVAPGAGPTEPRRMANRLAGNSTPPVRPLRTIRIRIGEVLSGVEPGQQEIEILTGLVGGDCGYLFQTASEYLVYAYKNSDGRLETGICSRTRPLAEAGDDVAYFRSMASAPATGTLRVQTAYPGMPGKRDTGIIAEQGGSRYRSMANAAGEALFANLPAGDYRIHTESDSDLPDDKCWRKQGHGSIEVHRAFHDFRRPADLFRIHMLLVFGYDPIPQACQPAHSRCHNDRIIPALGSGRQSRSSVAFERLCFTNALPGAAADWPRDNKEW